MIIIKYIECSKYIIFQNYIEYYIIMIYLWNIIPFKAMVWCFKDIPGEMNCFTPL